MPKEEIHHPHDVGYKHIFSHKQTFLELLRSFVKKDWVNLIKEEDLILVDKSYVLPDFEEEESDIVYRINIDGKEIIFYILLEFQSKVDFQMPIRLLFYMVEIWRELLKNTSKKTRRRKSFKLPAIIPIVLYNGKNNWTAAKSFKEILNGYELFEENILDFNYTLFDINRYEEEELYTIANLVSAVFLLDQEMDEKKLIRRLRRSISILKKISPEQFSVFKQWLKKIIKPRLDEKLQSEIEKILDKSNQEEVDFMVYNLEKTLDNIEKKGIKQGISKGIEQGIIQGENNKSLTVARNMLIKGFNVEDIVDIVGLSRPKILKIKKEIDDMKN
ncbi:Rpn family recombination-promoting nuclease/putative transposase [Marinisporobacter balticus]|uniref:Putative transposase/invertase (TIGR01784 family) n=1 Tax=Marinisporobacter balticus TaxID=2018667 RepID=A0A4R2K6R7_9FIRM|nr:Rpn family recombination-promoting nuclease/putative transposase [Marinisporobacter balticus]TCO68983.1 putative transposase/invertase (TIGR01784 family) [Marinisporobacter balticus]